MPNLRPKNFSEFFHFQSDLESEFFRGDVRAPTSFGHGKFEVKNLRNFSIYRVLWTLNFSQGGFRHQLFLVTLNLRSKSFQSFFHLQSPLDSEFFRWDVRAPIFFGHTKFKVKKFRNFFIYRVLWTLNFSERVSGHHLFFGHAKFEVKTFWEFFYLPNTLH